MQLNSIDQAADRRDIKRMGIKIDSLHRRSIEMNARNVGHDAVRLS
ncbi:MAG: hypothetical protein ACI8UO_001673 [Verrucomicrobiales bacterium]|jgi:hypothetical protein